MYAEIPTIIDLVALGYFIVALGSIILGISVSQYPCSSFVLSRIALHVQVKMLCSSKNIHNMFK